MPTKDIARGLRGRPLSPERKIPATMATQHPDNASAPHWGRSPFVSTQDEAEDCYRAFSELGCDEYMWDWEGKLVDEAVVDRLLGTYWKYFRRWQLGRDKFLTYRVPNIWEEEGFRLPRAFMTIISAAHTARQHGVHTPPLFEVILPMTTSSGQLLTVLRKYLAVLKCEKAIFEARIAGRSHLELIPLIEGSVTLLNSRRILEDYVKGYRELLKRRPPYLRPFIARSDPALDAGFVPATLSARGALSEYYRFQQETGIPVYPIIGVGCLPFRGGFSPNSIYPFLQNYSGIRTVTIQSAFRYDYPLPEVQWAIRTLKRRLQTGRPCLFSEAQIREIVQFTELFASYYRPAVTRLAATINDLARFVPRHRERIPHTGHFGYSRRVGTKKTKMPRAIAFVASLYSLGIPPELIGTGRGLQEVMRQGKLETLLEFLPTFRHDIIEAGHYLNRENLELLVRRNPAWKAIRDDIHFLEEFLGERLGPSTPEHFQHRSVTSTIYRLWTHGGEGLTDEILSAAQVRRSLG